MARTTNLSRPIIEALYTEALVLADEVRAVFAAGTREPVIGEDAFVRLALSTEGLKTTTRMMHVLAWLLNQHADYRRALRHYLMKLVGTRRQLHLYTDAGILSNEGLSTAFSRRLGEKLLPDIRKVEGGHQAIYNTRNYTRFRALLGRVIARLHNLAEDDCSVKTGALWWLRHRERASGNQTVVVTVQTPELL